jgi:hypothetical protein
MPRRSIPLSKGKLLVKRKGYYAEREGKRYYVPPTTYYRIDLGTKGRGKKVIPPLEKGKMTKIAQQMGYNKVTEIPDSKIDDFVEKLVKAYGEREAFGMIQAQRVFRKRRQDEAKRKFDLMYEAWRRKYAGGGWGS